MISIIIPTLDEERSLPPLLDAIHQQTAAHEVIVVDGGSQDRTLEVARDRGVRTLVSHPGRGAGISIGAEASRGDVLFFLHADSTLPPGALDRIISQAGVRMAMDKPAQGLLIRGGCGPAVPLRARTMLGPSRDLT